MTMTKESLAAQLNGIEYPADPHIRNVAADAKAAGLLIVYGASDDLMEFEGAFSDEVGCHDGGTAYLDRKGVLDRSQIDDSDDDAITDFTLRKRSARAVEAVWCPGEPNMSWAYRTDIPHATFDVMEDGEIYCRAIVIDIQDLPA